MSDSQESEGFKIRDRRFSALSEEEKKKKREEKPKVAGTGLKDQTTGQPPPKIDFVSFVFSLSTSALVQLGLIPDPHTNQTSKNLEQARQTIDILAILHEKTAGNLTDEEQKLLDNSLAELRMRYVSLAKQ